jgi:hypothetical protein
MRGSLPAISRSRWIRIVGAGPAGISVARELTRKGARAQAQGLCQLGPFDHDPGSGADPTRAPSLPMPPGAVETTLFQHGTAGFEGYCQELVRGPNATLLLHPAVVDLATGEDPGRVDRVEVRRDDGSLLRAGSDRVGPRSSSDDGGAWVDLPGRRSSPRAAPCRIGWHSTGLVGIRLDARLSGEPCRWEMDHVDR